MQGKGQALALAPVSAQFPGKATTATARGTTQLLTSVLQSSRQRGEAAPEWENGEPGPSPVGQQERGAQVSLFPLHRAPRVSCSSQDLHTTREKPCAMEPAAFATTWFSWHSAGSSMEPYVMEPGLVSSAPCFQAESRELHMAPGSTAKQLASSHGAPTPAAHNSTRVPGDAGSPVQWRWGSLVLLLAAMCSSQKWLEPCAARGLRLHRPRAP